MNDFLPTDFLFAVINVFSDARDLLRDFLAWIHSGVGSWGVAIILLTVIVRIVIFPLTWKQIRSQLAMQSLTPKVRELQQKYKNDKQRMQQETMRLYQEYRVNPFASCMPLLLQLPIFILLYYSIRNYAPLENAGFLWFTLGKQDPYYILLIVYIASQLVATELMLTPEMQTMQKWMMRGMPFFFVIFLRSFPSGLFVYWITTNLWTVGQVSVVRYLRKHHPVQLKPAEVSKRKPSRFMEAMATAQQRREEGGAQRRPAESGSQGQRSGRPQGKKGPKRKAGKPGAEPAQGKPARKPGQQPTSKPAGKPGQPPANGKQSGGKSTQRPQGKPGPRPEGRPQEKPAADAKNRRQGPPGSRPGARRRPSGKPQRQPGS